TPAVVDGKVFIGAGDDGLWCLSADKGVKRWNFPGFHIDAPPAVIGGNVYVGCGIGDTHKTTAIFWLAAATGKPRWRNPTNPPAWSRPIVSGGFVHVGTGNGRLNESAENPAGEVFCLRANDGHSPSGPPRPSSTSPRSPSSGGSAGCVCSSPSHTS